MPCEGVVAGNASVVKRGCELSYPSAVLADRNGAPGLWVVYSVAEADVAAERTIRGLRSAPKNHCKSNGRLAVELPVAPFPSMQEGGQQFVI